MQVLVLSFFKACPFWSVSEVQVFHCIVLFLRRSLSIALIFTFSGDIYIL